MTRLSAETCEACGCPPNHKSHMLPTYREHNHDPACCVEYLKGDTMTDTRTRAKTHAEKQLVGVRLLAEEIADELEIARLANLREDFQAASDAIGRAVEKLEPLRMRQ